jgi:hypothetical protein
MFPRPSTPCDTSLVPADWTHREAFRWRAGNGASGRGRRSLRPGAGQRKSSPWHYDQAWPLVHATRRFDGVAPVRPNEAESIELPGEGETPRTTPAERGFAPISSICIRGTTPRSVSRLHLTTTPRMAQPCRDSLSWPQKSRSLKRRPEHRRAPTSPLVGEDSKPREAQPSGKARLVRGLSRGVLPLPPALTSEIRYLVFAQARDFASSPTPGRGSPRRNHSPLTIHHSLFAIRYSLPTIHPSPLP